MNQMAAISCKTDNGGNTTAERTQKAVTRRES